MTPPLASSTLSKVQSTTIICQIFQRGISFWFSNKLLLIKVNHYYNQIEHHLIVKNKK